MNDILYGLVTIILAIVGRIFIGIGLLGLVGLPVNVYTVPLALISICLSEVAAKKLASWMDDLAIARKRKKAER